MRMGKMQTKAGIVLMLQKFRFELARACIGMRMGVVVTKIALTLLLKQYNFACVDDKELTIATHALTIAIKGGINVKVSKR